jgi:hypothetical protein
MLLIEFLHAQRKRFATGFELVRFRLRHDLEQLPVRCF